jgi:predicted nucleotidyltransferase
LFGSVARGEDGPESDVDLLVDSGPDVGLLQLIALRDEVGDALGTPVDVVPVHALKPEVAARALAEAVPL